jgi:hypothetical protein
MSQMSKSLSIHGIAATMVVVSLALGAEGPADPRSDMIETLAASGPHPSLGEEGDVFGRLVGTWDCDYSFHDSDGSVRHAKGELKVGWVLDGRAIQDIWIRFPDDGKGERKIGTTVRFFDAKAKTWRVVWMAPEYGVVNTLEGGAKGRRIVLRGTDGGGSSLRWSFDDIEADSFVWRGETSKDGGKSWRLEEEHHMRRRRSS